MENQPLFLEGDAVDMSTLGGWSFCGVIVSCCATDRWGSFSYWVKFVDKGSTGEIPERKHGAWYHEGNLRHSLIPPID